MRVLLPEQGWVYTLGIWEPVTVTVVCLLKIKSGLRVTYFPLKSPKEMKPGKIYL